MNYLLIFDDERLDVYSKLGVFETEKEALSEVMDRESSSPYFRTYKDDFDNLVVDFSSHWSFYRIVPTTKALTDEVDLNIELSKNIFRHKKTNNYYFVIGEGTLENTLEDAIVYKDIKSGRVWIRPKKEFMDGRFEKVNRYSFEWEK